jgi:predicted regulator of Ras-like GTPase activity (Roadblock/LC7/MglB family)
MRGNVFAALIASLFRKARQSARAAGFGEAEFLTLEAERGRVCAVGAEGLVHIAIADVRANLGLLRVEMLQARGSLARRRCTPQSRGWRRRSRASSMTRVSRMPC